MAQNLCSVDDFNNSSLLQNNLVRIGYTLLLCAVSLVPLAIFPAAADQAISIKYFILKALVLLMAGTFIGRALISGTNIKRSDMEWPVLVFTALIILATVVSSYPYASLEGAYLRYDGLYSHLIYIALFFAAIQYLGNINRLVAFSKLSVSVGALVSVYGIAQVAGFDPASWGYRSFEAGRGFATFGNPILLAPYLCILLPISIGIVVNDELKRNKIIFAIMTTLIAVSIITTMSRAAWIASIIGIALQVFVLVKKGRINLRNVTISALIIALAIIMLAAIIIGTQTLSERMSSIAGVDQSLDNRFSMWHSAIQIAKDNPLFGSGPDSLAFVYPRYESVYMARNAPNEIQTNMHNIYIQLAATSGIPALLAFLAVLALLLVKTKKYLDSIDQEQVYFEIPIISGLVGGIVAYLIQGTTGISGIVTSTFLWLFMGVLAGRWGEDQPVNFIKLRTSAKSIAVAGVIITIIMGTASGARVFMSDYYLGLARVAEINRDIDSALVLYQKAAAYNFEDEKALQEMGIMLADLGRTVEDKKLWLVGIGYLEESLSRNRSNHSSLLMLGQGYLYGAKTFDKKYYALAEENLGKSLKIRPHAPLANAMIGVVYIDTGRLDAAGESFAKALNINPGDPQAHYYYGQYFEKTGSSEKASQQYRIALEIDSSHEKARAAYESISKNSNK